jgi:uncharacterized protein (TIGR00251 family)
MINAGLQVSETGGGLTVRLHVLPMAKHGELAGLHNGALKVKVMAPPVENAANRAVIDFFSELLGISKSNLKILAGNKSREKVLQIKGLSIVDFMNLIS